MAVKKSVNRLAQEDSSKMADWPCDPLERLRTEWHLVRVATPARTRKREELWAHVSGLIHSSEPLIFNSFPTGESKPIPWQTTTPDTIT